MFRGFHYEPWTPQQLVWPIIDRSHYRFQRGSCQICLHSRYSRCSSFILSRYRALLVSAGLSILLLSTNTTEDTTELWGVDDSASSASIGVDLSCLVRLLLELSLESTLAPRRLDRGLVAKQGGIAVESKGNWTVSSSTDSSVFMCLWKTPFSRIIRKRSLHHVCHVQQSNGEHAPLLYLSHYLINVAHLLIHFHRVLVGPHIVGDIANREYRGIQINPQLLKNVTHFLVTFLDSPLDTSLVPFIRVTVCIFVITNIFSDVNI